MRKPELLAIEDVMGRDGQVTVVRFLVHNLLNSEQIQTIAAQLFSLVEEFGRTNLLLNFANLQTLVTELLGKLLKLREKINLAKGRLALCQFSPVVDEAFEVCGLKRYFVIYLNEQDALQAF